MYICIEKNITRRFMLAGLVAALATGAVLNHLHLARETASYEWGLHFEKPSSPPVPNLSDDKLNPYGAYYHGNLKEKKIYITFDAGYENGYTEIILDALKKHDAPAAFFLVGPYIKENPEIVKRMAAEGHTVGNHSYNHPDMTAKSKEDFLKELDKTRRIYKEVLGEDMPMFYRPPEGKFSTENLAWAKEAGYTTVLWSTAYVDWNNDSQPSHDYAYKKIEERTFPGAIILLHSTSKTNSEILDSQLTKWEEQGYTFGDINDLAKDYN